MANAQLSALSSLLLSLSFSTSTFLPASLSVTLVKWPENLHVQLAAASSVNYLCLLHEMQKLPRHQPAPSPFIPPTNAPLNKLLHKLVSWRKRRKWSANASRLPEELLDELKCKLICRGNSLKVI